MSLRNRLIGSALCLASLLVAAPRAEAEQAWQEARERFERGQALEEGGDLAAALAEYERAMELRPSFRLHRHLGRVCRGLGRYGEAIEHYQTFRGEGGDRLDAEERAEALEALEDLRGRVARLRVEAPAGATVLIDGRLLGEAPIGAEVLFDPGDHVLEARLTGHEPARRELTLTPGQSMAVTLELAPMSVAVGPEPDLPPRPDQPAEPAVTVEEPSPAPTPQQSRRRRVPRGVFWAIAGLSAASLASFAVLGALALSAESEFDRLDVEGRTLTDQQDLDGISDRGQRLVLGADLSLLVGGVLAAAALVLGFFTDFHRSAAGEESSSATATLDAALGLPWSL